MAKKSKTSVGFWIIILFGCVALMIYSIFPQPSCPLSVFEKRAVWLSYQDLSQLSYKNKKEFKTDFINCVQKIKTYKGNTLIVQVRPFADALYSSKYFPLSQAITKRDKLSFDPLQEMITIAHQEGMFFEAWINPYRISSNALTYQQFVENSKQKSWLLDSLRTIHYGEYQYIFNPASPQVRKLIVNGIEEIVSNYSVDGIHFDDYFYVPHTYGQTTQKQRQEKVNLLIQDVYLSIKAIRQDVTFGISPQGNYENCLVAGADVTTWLQEEGFVDYVMPQIYWSNQYGKDGRTKMFANRAQQFAKIQRHKNVKLYAGLALYRAGQTLESDLGWSISTQNLSQQIQKLYVEGYDGYSLFRYDSLNNQAGQKEMDELLSNHPF